MRIPAKHGIFFALFAFLILASASGTASATDLNLSGEDVTISKNGSYTITQTGSDEPIAHTVKVASGVSADITLAGVNIEAAAGKAALELENGSASFITNVTLRMAEGTTNILKAGDITISAVAPAGIQVPQYSSLTIEGPGELRAFGAGFVNSGNDGNKAGAGIGTGSPAGSNTDTQAPAGKITITGGTIMATGGRGSSEAPTYCGGAGIGGGTNGLCSEIRITGGTVTATGGTLGAAGIGSGPCSMAVGQNNDGKIIITGGTVTARPGDTSLTGATARSPAAAIGGGLYASGGEITISGGEVYALPSSPNNRGGGIGSGIGNAVAGTISITGGYVEAIGGIINPLSSPVTTKVGIGGVKSGGTLTIGDAETGTGPVIKVSSMDVTRTDFAGIIFEPGVGDLLWGGTLVSDDVTLASNVTVPDGTILTVESGKTLMIDPGATLSLDGGATLVNNGTIINDGIIAVSYGAIFDEASRENVRGGGEIRDVAAPETPAINEVSSFVISPDRIAVSFTPGDDGGLDDITYTVECYERTAAGDESRGVTSGGESPITVVGLQAGRTYYFKVKAVNAIGESDFSEASGLSSPGSTGPTHVIGASPDVIGFGTVTENYEPVGAREIGIRNIGTGTLTGLAVRIAGGNSTSFEIVEDLDGSTLGTDGNAVTVTVRPKDNLEPGTHNSYLQLTADAAEGVRVMLSFVVSDSSISIPDNYYNVLWTNYDYKRLQADEETPLWARLGSEGQEPNNSPTNLGANKRFDYSTNFEVISGDSVEVKERSGKEATIKAVRPGISVVKVTKPDSDIIENHDRDTAVPDCNAAYVVYEVADPENESDVNLTTSIKEDMATVERSVGGSYQADISSYKTIYFARGDTVRHTFTVRVDQAAEVTVRVNIDGNNPQVKTESLAAGREETFTVDLGNRDNIIQVTAKTVDGKTKNFFKVVKARKIDIIVENLSKPGAAVINEGERIRVSFKGITLPVFQVSGMYNPFSPMYEKVDGYDVSYVSYTNEELGEYRGKGGQYDLGRNNSFELRFADEGDYLFTSGKIVESWFASRSLGHDKTTPGTESMGGYAPVERVMFRTMPDFTLRVSGDDPWVEEPEPPVGGDDDPQTTPEVIVEIGPDDIEFDSENGVETITVPENALTAAIEQAAQNAGNAGGDAEPTLVIKGTATKDDGLKEVKVTVSVEVLSALAQSAPEKLNVKIDSPVGEVTLNKAAIISVVEKADESIEGIEEIQIVIEKKDKAADEDLTLAQKAAVSDDKVREVYDFSLYTDRAKQSKLEFDASPTSGAYLTIGLPYTLDTEKGEIEEGVGVEYLPENDAPVPMPSSYDTYKELVLFKTSHLSVYAVTYNPEQEEKLETSGGGCTAAGGMGLLLALAFAASRRRAKCA
jgi:VCBS repeat-containing protein